MRFTTIIASAAVAAVLGGAGVSVAGAASNPGSTSAGIAATTAASSTPSSTVAKPAAGKATSKAGAKATAKKRAQAVRRRIRRGAGRISAETIGITRPVLRQELRAGKTIAAIATEHGVQPQAVITALESAANTKIDAAAAAHKITPTRAAKLKTRLQTAIPKLVNDWHPKHGAKG